MNFNLKESQGTCRIKGPLTPFQVNEDGSVNVRTTETDIAELAPAGSKIVDLRSDALLEALQENFEKLRWKNVVQLMPS